MSEPAVSVLSVAKKFDTVVALDGLDLEVEPGTIVGVVGANGAGKSTLIRLLVGALMPDAGSVRVLGLDPLRDRQQVRASIGYMPQATVLYPDLTVRENLRFFAAGQSTSREDVRVQEVLDFVDLAAAADRLLGNLSGGQQRRASLAVALVHRPDVLFLDEPTAGVDPELRHTFWARFRELADDGVTLVVSTHQMDEVAHCDRIALMRSGGVLVDSSPANLFASGGSTVRLWRGGEREDHHVASLAYGLPQLLAGMGLDRRIDRIEIKEPTLEDVILELIERQRSDDDPA